MDALLLAHGATRQVIENIEERRLAIMDYLAHKTVNMRRLLLGGGVVTIAVVVFTVALQTLLEQERHVITRINPPSVEPYA